MISSLDSLLRELWEPRRRGLANRTVFWFSHNRRPVTKRLSLTLNQDVGCTPLAAHISEQRISVTESEWAKRMAQEFKAGMKRKSEEYTKLPEERGIRKECASKLAREVRGAFKHKAQMFNTVAGEEILIWEAPSINTITLRRKDIEECVIRQVPCSEWGRPCAQSPRAGLAMRSYWGTFRLVWIRPTELGCSRSLRIPTIRLAA
jgi:hypothetical protein